MTISGASWSAEVSDCESCFKLASLRQGSKTYRSQVVVRADSGITSIDQLRGKKFAFVDPASASGFLFPNALLAGMVYARAQALFAEDAG